MYCERKLAGGLLAGVGDAIQGLDHVELESSAFESRYRLLVPDGTDQNPIRQLFEPSFIVLMSEKTPDAFSFELEDGMLCASVPEGLWEKPAELDALCDAAAKVAARFREEAGEAPTP
jgi:hypothetical protein